MRFSFDRRYDERKQAYLREECRKKFKACVILHLRDGRTDEETRLFVRPSLRWSLTQ